jgi:hypothetical protein
MTGEYARAVEASKNGKLGDCSATYVGLVSCWKGCAFYEKGCYGMHDLVGFQARQLDRLAGGRTAAVDARVIARDEARLIDRLSAERDLRIHVVGDSRSNASTEILAKAAARYRRRSRGRRKVWSYCHTWRTVARKSWGVISCLASCETLTDVRAAMRRGYAAALVVESHPADGKAFIKDGLRHIPCPNQTRGVTCADCKLCWSDGLLRKMHSIITFAVHGGGRKAAAESLIQIQALAATTVKAKALFHG